MYLVRLTQAQEMKEDDLPRCGAQTELPNPGAWPLSGGPVRPWVSERPELRVAPLLHGLRRGLVDSVFSGLLYLGDLLSGLEPWLGFGGHCREHWSNAI